MTKTQKKTVLDYATQAVALSEAVAKLHADVEYLGGKVHLDAFGKCAETDEEEARLMNGAADRLMQAESTLLEAADFLCAAIGESVERGELVPGTFEETSPHVGDANKSIAFRSAQPLPRTAGSTATNTSALG